MSDKPFEKALIITGPYLKERFEMLKEVTSFFHNIKWHIFDEYLLNKSDYENLNKIISDYDLLITLGGDGSILKIAQVAAFNNKAILGVNYGGIGYLTSIKKDKLELLKRLDDGEYRVEERSMLEVDVFKNKGDEYKHLALNDVVIFKSDINIPIKLEVNDEFCLNTYFADGLIVSTPTGSSAYSYSAGAPLLDINENKVILTPICPVSRSSTYKIYDDSVLFSIKSCRENRDKALLSVDGASAYLICKDDLIKVKRSKYKTRIVKF